MQSFELLSQKFALHFGQRHFPAEPASLYDPNEYFLSLGGKRIRPTLCLIGNELFVEQVLVRLRLMHQRAVFGELIFQAIPLDFNESGIGPLGSCKVVLIRDQRL